MAWVTKDSTETYNQTPEPPREYTKAEKAANWWHYHWVAVVIGVAAVFFIQLFNAVGNAVCVVRVCAVFVNKCSQKV